MSFVPCNSINRTKKGLFELTTKELVEYPNELFYIKIRLCFFFGLPNLDTESNKYENWDKQAKDKFGYYREQRRYLHCNMDTVSVGYVEIVDVKVTADN